jgi:Arc/MetJ-type ribon-helix-helix transcriptional regulator
MATLTVRIPEKLRREIQAVSKAERVAVSDIVRESVRRYVAIRRFRSLRRKVLPFAEAQGLLTDEEVFRALK